MNVEAAALTTGYVPTTNDSLTNSEFEVVTDDNPSQSALNTSTLTAVLEEFAANVMIRLEDISVSKWWLKK